MSRVRDRLRFLLDHRWTPRHMSEYLDRELEAEDRRRLEHHTSVCPKCRAVLEALRRLTAALGGLALAEGGGHGAALALAVRGRLDEPRAGPPA